MMRFLTRFIISLIVAWLILVGTFATAGMPDTVAFLGAALIAPCPAFAIARRSARRHR